LLGLIYTDVYGPMPIHTINKYTYFIIFTYNLSRYDYVYLMKYKSKSFKRFKEFRNEVEKQTRKNIKIL
jgi:hypothetical protein